MQHKGMTLPDMIRAGRVAKGWTQNELAETIGLSQSAISRYESGEREPRLDDLFALTQTLGIKGKDVWLVLGENSS